RLLDHVADPAGGRGDENAERQGRSPRAGQLVAQQLISDLRPVAMHDRDVPARGCELDDGAEALAGVRELLVDVTVLARRLQRIATERHHNGGRLIGSRHRPRHDTGVSWEGQAKTLLLTALAGEAA